MNTIAISDLHAETGLIVRGKCIDDFGPANGPADYDLICAVEGGFVNGRYEPNIVWPPNVVLIGDIFELHQALAHIAARDPKAALDLIFHAHPGIAAIWPYVAKDVTGVRKAIIGNHEAPHIKPGFVYRGVEFVDNAIFEVGGERVWAEHGHAHDPLVARWPWLCRRVVGVVGWAERRWHPDVDKWASRLGHWLMRTGRHGANEKYWEPVAQAAWEHGCKVAVFGHTHKKEHRSLWLEKAYQCEECGGPMAKWMHLHNMGTWIDGKRDVTRIEQ